MDLTPLSSHQLRSQPRNERTYKHFRSDLHTGKSGETDHDFEFFYIGKQSSKIGLLVSAFASGYAADSIDSARSVLSRIAEKNRIPDIMIVDGPIGEAALKDLHTYLSASQEFLLMPVVVNAENFSPAAISRYRKNRFVDDLVFLDNSTIDRFYAMTGLLGKMKKLTVQARQEKQHRMWFIAGRKYRNFFKRLFDIVTASTALLVLTPLFLLVAAAIKVESAGPVFYVAKRAGRGYRMFSFFKFRTMVQDADKEIDQLSHLNHYKGANGGTGAVFFKMHDDKRITRVGTFLRSVSMDELPQLVNVLLGDMSLVGNRPLPLYEAAKLTTDQWAERFLAPAGITGLWQIKKRKLASISIEDRINMDITYSRRYNFLYDLWIIAHTPSALIQRSNA